MNDQADTDKRRDTFRSLMKIDKGLSTEQLHALVRLAPELREDVLIALLQQNDPSTAQVLLQLFPSLSPNEKRSAVSVLVTRKQFAIELLAAIRNQIVSRADVSAFALQQLQTYSDSELQQQIATLWADDDTSPRKADEINRLQQLMSEEYLSTGNAHVGRTLFDRTCSKCHRLFGEGGDIAPDLTGSGRKKADYVIRNLVDPSEDIDAAYRLTNVLTADGRLFSGFIVQQDDYEITVRTQDARVRLEMKDVEEVATSKVSMMPEGMLKTLTDEQFRDLLVYLASDDQVSPAENETAR